MNNNKKILAIVLVFLVLLLGGASVYVATQLSTRQKVAPTAPESKPKAAEDEYVGCPECTVTALATEVDIVCVPSGVVTCTTPVACPTTCGLDASVQTGCADSCGNAVDDKTCAATADCEVLKAVLEGSKSAYKNVASNTPGVYTLSSLMEFVSKSQIYVYTIELKNISETTASEVVVKDSLANMPVTYMDAVAGCSYSTGSLELTCNTSIKPNETKKLSFRVKASDGIVNGTVISNIGKVTYPDGSLDVTKDLTASSIVGCNHTCTTIEECSTGLTCDTTTSKCRIATCLAEDDCNCPSVVVPTATRAPGATTVAPTRVVTTIAKASPTILPETGIFDLPGIAAFGGGLFLAIIGILLAL